MRLISWNVNGIRAAAKSGLLDVLRGAGADALCLQETRAHPDQVVSSLREPEGYSSFWAFAERRGYSGVALFSRVLPVEVTTGLGVPRFDAEGRVLIARYPQFLLFNVYFPNGKMNAERLQYKLDFYEEFLSRLVDLRRRGERIVVCGDYNTAHKEIDLSHPKNNVKVSGFLPEERAWMDRLTAHGFIDTFRMFHSDGGHYTWWDMRTRARERNIGWRLDYFFVSDNLAGAVRDAAILPEVGGSDHCPVSLTLET
ncbi:MAG: exodeoxyribonuclease III [Dehalococcoidia bacterium]|jgi:exodeoxyribonuclease-3|nr:exodeoxyribonuclease III [Dehalococcoidia bacterium]